MAGIFVEFLENKLSEQDEQLRQQLASFIKEENIDIAVAGVQKYIMGMPVSLKIFASLVLDPQTPPDIRSYFSLVVAYLINPENFQPEPEFKGSLLSLVDDAYLLHSSLEIVMKTLDERKRSRYSEKLKSLEPVFKFSPMVRSKLPEDTLKKLDVIINYLEKLLEVKSMAKESLVYVLPPS